MIKYIFGLLIFAVLLAPVRLVSAEASVGLGTAKITPLEPLTAGLTTQLEPVVVHNDGDLPGTYVMSVMFNETQVEHKPDAAWFSFSHSQFELQPGESKVIELSIAIPKGAKSGEYFAYIEAGCTKLAEDETESFKINASSAAKLGFVVKHIETHNIEPIAQAPTHSEPNILVSLQLERKPEMVVLPGLKLNKALTLSSIL